VTAFKLQTRALEDAQAGNLAGAQQKLTNAVTMLLSQGETDLAHQLQFEADRLARGRQVSAEGRKTIQFTSRKTVRLS
jgi:Ca-activated chloride channel family protein